MIYTVADEVEVKNSMLELLNKLEQVLSAEIRQHQTLMEYEYKKMNAILENRLQDLDLYINFQTRKIEEIKQLGGMRESLCCELKEALMPRRSDVTLKDLLQALPLKYTIKISALRLELKSLIAKLKNMNKLIPRLLKQGFELFKGTKDMLSETRKAGYNNKGKAESAGKKMSLLLNRTV